MAAVIEQVQHFKDTKYATDSRGINEVAFEKILGFDRRAGFQIRVCTKAKDGKYEINTKILHLFLNMMYSLGGPKLLARAPRKEEDEDGDADDVEANTEGPSFRADRRVIRLLIARYWSDLIMNAYKKAHKDN